VNGEVKMSLLDKIGDLYSDPVLAIWSFLSLPASGLLLLISLNNPIMVFYLFLTLSTFAWLIAAPTVFKETAHASVDWNEEIDFKKVLSLSVLGIAALLIIGFAFSTLFFGQISSAIWVPSTLLPLALTGSGFTVLMSNLFATTFAVVPGEESGKAIFTVLFRAYHNAGWAEKLPFALQPAVMAGVVYWAAEHVAAGQYPLVFALNVFVSGLVMKTLAAQSGTYLTSWIIHLGYNFSILITAFVSSLMRT
jgi:hypothetical protein